MARYYTEELDNRIHSVVAQDETGIYAGVARKQDTAPGGWEVWLMPIWEPDMIPKALIRLPEWQEEREVAITSLEFLDFVRRMDRGDYTNTIPSEIKTLDGSAEEVIRTVLLNAGRDRVCLR